MHPVIQLHGVDARYGPTLALESIDLSIAAGTMTAVIGPNGAGKSTLFGLISTRLRPSAGTVTTDGAVAEVLQGTRLDPQLRLTVDDVVRIGRFPARGLIRPMRRVDRRACHEALDRLGLLELRTRPISELSGGQRQRTLVAQGIAQPAPVLLLDEPATALDVASQQLILDVMRDEAAGGRAVVFSTHHLAHADEADTVVALACRCVCCGPPATTLEDPRVTALFESPGLRGRSDRHAASRDLG